MNNNLKTIINQSVNYYSWTLTYASQVAYEYECFMLLRSINNKLSPSDDIDKFWHLHLLNPIFYYNYCNEQFNKIIDHCPADSFDKHAREQRLTNTKNEYKKKFGDFACPNVWNVKNKCDNINKINDSTNTRPTDKIKVNIFYTFDTKTADGVQKIWKRNNNKYDDTMFDIDKKKVGNETLNDLAKNISVLTRHENIGIHFYSETEKLNVLAGKNTKNGFRCDISRETLLKNINQNIICILEEVSQHGYC